MYVQYLRWAVYVCAAPSWHGIHPAQIKAATIVQIYLLTNIL
jgi:hypothetical protein